MHLYAAKKRWNKFGDSFISIHSESINFYNSPWNWHFELTIKCEEIWPTLFSSRHAIRGDPPIQKYCSFLSLSARFRLNADSGHFNVTTKLRKQWKCVSNASPCTKFCALCSAGRRLKMSLSLFKWMRFYLTDDLSRLLVGCRKKNELNLIRRSTAERFSVCFFPHCRQLFSLSPCDDKYDKKRTIEIESK